MRGVGLVLCPRGNISKSSVKKLIISNANIGAIVLTDGTSIEELHFTNSEVGAFYSARGLRVEKAAEYRKGVSVEFGEERIVLEFELPDDFRPNEALPTIGNIVTSGVVQIGVPADGLRAMVWKGNGAMPKGVTYMAATDQSRVGVDVVLLSLKELQEYAKKIGVNIGSMETSVFTRDGANQGSITFSVKGCKDSGESRKIVESALAHAYDNSAQAQGFVGKADPSVFANHLSKSFESFGIKALEDSVNPSIEFNVCTFDGDALNKELGLNVTRQATDVTVSPIGGGMVGCRCVVLLDKKYSQANGALSGEVQVMQSDGTITSVPINEAVQDAIADCYGLSRGFPEKLRTKLLQDSVRKCEFRRVRQTNTDTVSEEPFTVETSFSLTKSALDALTKENTQVRTDTDTVSKEDSVSVSAFSAITRSVSPVPPVVIPTPVPTKGTPPVTGTPPRIAPTASSKEGEGKNTTITVASAAAGVMLLMVGVTFACFRYERYKRALLPALPPVVVAPAPTSTRSIGEPYASKTV